MPDITPVRTFLVTWTGQDDMDGSGLASFDLYVSDNGGPWILWLEHTSNTSAAFSGENGHTYAFFSTARDGVGLEEMPPDSADARTTVAENVMLRVELRDGIVVLSWPQSVVACQLEVAENLSPPRSWQPVTAAPVVMGERWFLSVAPEESTRFFRLVCPD